MSRGPIHLHIEELVLDGFNPADRHRIADAMQRELHVLLRRHGVPGPWQSGCDQLDAGAIQVHGRPPVAHTGAQIARAIHGGAVR